jgi:hypothetical protein
MRIVNVDLGRRSGTFGLAARPIHVAEALDARQKFEGHAKISHIVANQPRHHRGAPDAIAKDFRGSLSFP